MKTASLALIRRVAPIVLGGAFVLAITPASAANATDAAALHRLADEAAKLPLETSCEKDASGQKEAPYVLTLKNTSGESLKVSATIDMSVVVHNRAKSRTVPSHVIEAGQSWKLDDLAAGDKVTVTADGFAPLVLTVP